MDPVSRLLLERERQVPRRAPWVVVAIMVHLTVVVGVILISRLEPSPPPHIPAVSVRLVSPRLSEPSGGGGRRQRPAAQPKQPKPEPRKEPQPRPEVVPPPAEQQRPAATENAMVEPERAEPLPTPVAEPEPGGGGAEDETGNAGYRPGLSLGGSAGGGEPAIPSDFQFGYYVERMLALIESKWYRPPVPAGTRARVKFTITTSGRLEGIMLEEGSGVPSFDRAVLRALYAANPLPPLPPAYRKPSLTVHINFAR